MVVMKYAGMLWTMHWSMVATSCKVKTFAIKKTRSSASCTHHPEGNIQFWPLVEQQRCTRPTFHWICTNNNFHAELVTSGFCFSLQPFSLGDILSWHFTVFYFVCLIAIVFKYKLWCLMLSKTLFNILLILFLMWPAIFTSSNICVRTESHDIVNWCSNAFVS
jgi:hypothetical protein